MKKFFVSFCFMFVVASSLYATNAIYVWYQQHTDCDEVLVNTLNMKPYQVDAADANTTYIRYKGGTGTVLLIKISVSSTVTTFEKSYDTWTNRAGATYTAIND